MSTPERIPVFTLFGETEHFPDVIHCERFSARAPVHGWKISAHRHAQMAQFFLVRNGRIEANVDGRSCVLETGAFLYIPANKVHGFAFRPDTEGLVVSMPLSVVNTVGPATPDIQDALAAPIVAAAGPELVALADLLAVTLAGTGPFRTQQAVGLAHSVLGFVADRVALVDGAGRGAWDPRIRRLDQLIAQHMADGWSASDYASALSISPGHLSRLCRAATGRGSAAYVEQAVIEEACRLLAFTQLPVSEVGYRLGYVDPSYFSKRFRHVRRMSPRAYRARFVS